MDRQRGSLTREQLDLILRYLPLDLSFADKDDVLVFWSGATYDTCDPAFIGRDVRDCHPSASLATLEEILAAFKDGTRDVAEGWETKADGSLVLTRYHAVRDDGAYRGILEINIDATDVRALSGARTLPGWDAGSPEGGTA